MKKITIVPEFEFREDILTQILQHIRKHKKLTKTQLSILTNIPKKSLEYWMNRLEETGYVTAKFQMCRASGDIQYRRMRVYEIKK